MIRIIDSRKEEDKDLLKKLLDRSQLDESAVLKRVEEITSNVRIKGNSAVFEYTKMFDKVDITAENIKVSRKEIDDAYCSVDKELIDIIRRAKANIEEFHIKQKEKSWFSTEKDGVILGQILRPLEVVGVYVPGGTAPLPSSVLMNVMPAKVAGVEKIVMATPPGRDGTINPVILVAANEAGADEIYKMGGAQAIAALAFGTESVPKVDKVTGPGNIYVNMAKRLVYGYCDIDMFAGPSEIMVVADKTANAKFAAADLLSQAEHDVLSASVLVTDSEKLAQEVKCEIERQTEYLGRKEIINKSIGDYGAIVIVNDMEEAVQLVNKVAPEHLELCVEEPFGMVGEIKNAGAIFLGNYASEPLGDYFAGPNHVLPTSGTARFFSPLNVGDFVKKSSLISYSRKALSKVKDDVIRFAEAEGLSAHANAIRVRFEKGSDFNE